MSQQLARRTGAVGVLAVLAGVTSVAGVWPVLGTASAAELRPGRVHEAAEKVGKAAAPGQERKVAEPVTDEADPATTEEPAEPTEQEATEQEATGPPTGVPAASAGRKPGTQKAADPTSPGAAEAPAAKPVPAPAAKPVPAPAAKPVPAPAAEPVPAAAAKPVPAPAAEPVPAPAEVVPATTGVRGVLDASPRTARAPRLQPLPSTGTAPALGPAVPPQVLPPARLARALPRSIPMSTVVVRSGPAPRLLPVTAVDAVPLRPAGAGSAARAVPRTDPLAISLTTLPGFAAGTAGAVARSPELPLGLAAVVVVFLLLQGRIDRRDPKLALAPVEEDEPLEFGPPAAVRVRVVAA